MEGEGLVGASVDPWAALQETVDDVSSYLNTTTPVDLKTPPAVENVTDSLASLGTHIQVI